MKKITELLCVFSIVLSGGLCFELEADQLIFNDGKVIDGKFKGANDSNVFFVVKNKGEVFALSTISEIKLKHEVKKKRKVDFTQYAESKMIVSFSKSISKNDKAGTLIYASLFEPAVIEGIVFEQGSVLIAEVEKSANGLRIRWNGIRKDGDDFRFSESSILEASKAYPDTLASESVMFVASKHKNKPELNASVKLEGDSINVPRGTVIELFLKSSAEESKVTKAVGK